MALFFADSTRTLLRLFPLPVLGIILPFGGLELPGAGTTAYLTSLLLDHAVRRRLITL